mgnify:CR=1 FL=1
MYSSLWIKRLLNLIMMLIKEKTKKEKEPPLYFVGLVSYNKKPCWFMEADISMLLCLHVSPVVFLTKQKDIVVVLEDKRILNC